MTSNRWHLEVWSLPFGTSQRIIARLPYLSASFDVEVGKVGRGQVVVPADYDRLSDIVNDSPVTASYIRAYRDGSLTPHLSFFARRSPTELTDQGHDAVILTGPTLAYGLEMARLENFDYPAQPSIDPDWEWGGPVLQGLENAGFENTEGTGFEDDTAGGWVDTTGSGDFVAPQVPAEVTTDDAFSGTRSLTFDPATKHSGVAKTITVQPGGRYQFTIRSKSLTVGKRFTFSVSIGAGAVIHHTNGFAYNGLAMAELGNAARNPAANGLPGGSTDGTWQLTTLDVTMGSDQTEATLYFLYDHHDGSDGPRIYLDDFTAAGPGIGLTPWEPAAYSGGGSVTEFIQDNTRVSEGAAAAKVTVNSTLLRATGIRQRITGLTPGRTYTVEFDISHDGAGAEGFWAVIKRGEAGGWAVSQQTSVPAGTGFTTIRATGVVDVSDVFIEVRWEGVGTRTFWVDNARVRSGLAASTVGGIWQAIMDDAAVDHTGEAGALARSTLDWLDYSSFTAALDSAGAAWQSGNSDGTIAYRGTRGKKYSQIRSDHQRLGYELEVVDGAGGPALNAYNPYSYTTRTGGAGVNRSGTLHPLRYGSGVTGGPKVVQVLTPNVAHVEGDDQEWERRKVTTGLDDFEVYVGDDTLTDRVTITDLADQVLEQRTDPTVALKLTLQPSDDSTVPLPTRDFDLGDTIDLDLAGDFTGAKRVVKMTVSIDSSGVGSYVLEFDQTAWTSDPMKALAEAVRRLMAQFDALRRPPDMSAQPDSGGGDFTGPIEVTYLVVSSLARPELKQVADFICDGIDDQEEIQAAINAASGGLSSRGRVILGDGIYFITGDLTVPFDVDVHGVGREHTVLESVAFVNHTLRVEGGLFDVSLTEDVGG